MSYKIEEIEGIGPVFAGKLAKADITTTDHLLEKCGSRKGRSDISKVTECTESQLLKWANMADLMRISGVGSEYSELLEAAGVDTVKELRTRNAANLTEAMKTTNETKKLTRQTPSLKNVEDWIAQAKTMDPKVSH